MKIISKMKRTKFVTNYLQISLPSAQLQYIIMKRNYEVSETIRVVPYLNATLRQELMMYLAIFKGAKTRI